MKYDYCGKVCRGLVFTKYFEVFAHSSLSFVDANSFLSVCVPLEIDSLIYFFKLCHVACIQVLIWCTYIALSLS